MKISSSSRLKSIVRAVVPANWRKRVYLWRVERKRKMSRTKSTQAVFSEVYERNDWGGQPGEFFSGEGSSGPLAHAYVELIGRFVREHNVHTIVDLGCGDFRIGQQVAEHVDKYVGVDIVPKLIERNRKQFGGEGVAFYCLDIIQDALPAGDLCLIRQVFQHLSNQQIAAVLAKTGQYRYTIVTEHYPAASVGVIPNVDKPHGRDTRLTDNSGVYLDRPPFAIPNVQTLLEIEAVQFLVAKGETIRTVLIDTTGKHETYGNF
jgi:hypothetical protein